VCRQLGRLNCWKWTRQDGGCNQVLGWAVLFFHRVILCYNAVLHSLIAAVPCGLCSC
jgi:hypothetical protein